MPTPSDIRRSGNWGARPVGPKQSVFPNYPAEGEDFAGAAPESEGAVVRELSETEVREHGDRALARSFIYRVLAAAFADPRPETWAWLSNEEVRSAFRKAWLRAGAGSEEPVRFDPDGFEAYRGAYAAAFGHSARGVCPVNEIEYQLPHVDPLFHPHRLADLAGFYRAFGMELAEDADERPDHASVELEFLCVLTAKEAWHWQHGAPEEPLQRCREAQRKFLREHAGQWMPAFARRLERLAEEPVLRAVARCTHAFIAEECRRLQVAPGSDQLGLRPVNEALERLCASCGLAAMPPGAGGPPA